MWPRLRTADSRGPWVGLGLCLTATFEWPRELQQDVASLACVDTMYNLNVVFHPRG